MVRDFKDSEGESFNDQCGLLERLNQRANPDDSLATVVRPLTLEPYASALRLMSRLCSDVFPRSNLHK